MGTVHTMKTPPLLSPAEAPDPVAHLPHSRRSSQSTLPRVTSGNLDAKPPDGRFTSTNDGIRRRSVDFTFQAHESPTHPGAALAPPGEQDKASALELEDEQGRRTLEDLRKQMEELLVFQQLQHRPARLDSSSSRQKTALGRQVMKTKLRPSSPPSLPLLSVGLPSSTHSDSTGSGGTIKSLDSKIAQDQSIGQTPSYPFPKMRTQDRVSGPKMQDDATPNKRFKISLPSEKSIPYKASTMSSVTQGSTLQNNFFLPLDGKPVFEDPMYPSPNLYDLVLKLNANPGLDAWWSNVVSILHSHYGAERASLAVPGDSTDLENVPWGQKAVFNEFGKDQDPPDLTEDSPIQPGNDSKDSKPLRKKDVSEAGANAKTSGSTPIVKRPSLLARHSFAGFDKDGAYLTSRDLGRLLLHPSLKGSMVPEANTPHGTNEKTPAADPESRQGSKQRSLSESSVHTDDDHRFIRQAVFPVSRPLEVDADPLIKRTGVVKLFGRAKPVVLTRDYSHDAAVSVQAEAEDGVKGPAEKMQITPVAEPSQSAKAKTVHVRATRSKSTSNLNALNSQSQESSFRETYDEYEQVPPSPWSQSPAPSPAPRAQADQNPFFASHAVDEEAFSKNPPSHDYSNPEPLEAIGIDTAKSIVHIPLLHASTSSNTSPSILRFPVAIISFLAPIIPYPPNLCQSLAWLMPHLTTSFVLAQQYTHLERQITFRLEPPRYGHLLGLGGTFSDESSELELVAGLSGHVSYGLGDDNSVSARASLSSPGEQSTSTKFSPAISAFGTPALDTSSVGSTGASFPNDSPGTSARHNVDVVDSYFNVHQTKGFRDAMNRQRSRLSKSKQSLSVSTPSSSCVVMGKSPNDDEQVSQKRGSVVRIPSTETKGSTIASSSQASQKHPSTASLYVQLQREVPRPFPDTIAQLMLNSVPLHLFLAKPQTGEIIWTNSKFDAYRRSQPQEQKSRNPWQSVHPSELEHLSLEWDNALRTGSQFTERVRVMRFNAESAYRWFIFRANPLLSATGEVLYWIGSFLDIHEQHIAELKATQEREKFAIDAKYRAFSNSIPQVVFEAGEYRGIIFVNEQWHLYTGQRLDDALNLGFTKHVHPDDLEKCGLLSVHMADSLHAAQSAASSEDSEQIPKGKSVSPERHFDRGVTPALDELVRRGVVSVQRDENGRVFYSTEIRLRSKGGDYRWHLVRLVKVETSSFGTGEASWYGTCTDINDRKLLEKELNKAMQQLNKEMESKTKFFSNMSHEIRTPLNGILGTIPFILDTQLDSDQRRMMDTIQNSSTNLRELVDNILDVSRVEAGKMTLVNSWFHVRSVLEDVIDTVSSRAIDKGLEINYLMDVDVPAMVIGDRFRIRQVLINLVGNAVKFTSRGEIYTRCSILRDPSVNLKATQILLNFDVVDTGKGFSATDAEQLMQRFTQIGENNSQQHAGSGLGLFLSKQLVEMHGGRLTPSGKEGQGAKFSFFVKVDAPRPPSHAESKLIRQSSDSSEILGLLSKAGTLQQSFSLPKELEDLKVLDMRDFSPASESSYDQPSVASDPSLRHTSHYSSGPSLTSSPLSPLEQKPMPKRDIRSRPQLVDTTSVLRGETFRPSLVTSHSQSSMSMTTSHSSSSYEVSSQTSYAVLIIAPLDNAREAIKRHIEQVVPHEVPYTIASLSDHDDWKDMIRGDVRPGFTHVVLNLTTSEDILEAFQFILKLQDYVVPTVVVISDLYQKRQFKDRIKDLVTTGRQVFTVPKPVKPSAFSPIFDPQNLRDLSKDRNQDMAREINDNFRSMSKVVKEVLGNKGYRILLVEDDDTNRMVMLKYLDKIKVISETATNGQECTEMVFSKEPGYYSLIICDIQMPVKNGYETCREIREWEQKNRYPQVPIMALSANAMSDQIENAAQAGFNDYVTKPIKHNELGKMMMDLLNPSRPLILLRDRLNRQGNSGNSRP